jgi:hypothetical protein
MSYLNRTIYMPWELLKAFSEHTGLFWSSIEIEGAICDAIALAMAPQSAQAQSAALEDAAAQGYQWKQVFLPAGTVLRASFGREPYYAVVEGCEIKYGAAAATATRGRLSGCVFPVLRIGCVRMSAAPHGRR